MKSKIFFDTNVLIYSSDKFDRPKQKRALNLLKEAANEDAVVISTQVYRSFM